MKSIVEYIRETKEEDLPFVYGDPDSARSGSCTGEEQERFWKSIGKHYSEIYITTNGVDLYTVNTKNGKNPVYFSTKAEVRNWIKKHIDDKDVVNDLMSKIKQQKNKSRHTV